MFIVSNTTWPVWVGQSTASDPRTKSTIGNVHAPARYRSCEDADRVADEQITHLLASLDQPCRECGRVRTEEEDVD